MHVEVWGIFQLDKAYPEIGTVLLVESAVNSTVLWPGAEGNSLGVSKCILLIRGHRQSSRIGLSICILSVWWAILCVTAKVVYAVVGSHQSAHMSAMAPYHLWLSFSYLGNGQTHFREK